MDERRIKKVLKKIRHKLKADGGDVKLISARNGIVKVKLMGACKGCPRSRQTVKNIIEKNLKKKISEVRRVKTV
ncbi:MAG: NifU family protein [Halanaerobiaceae bacterium]